MSINIRYLGRRTSNSVRNAPGSYFLHGPENREPYIPPYPPLPATPAPPTPPTPPTPSYIISGTVSENGTGFSALLGVSSVGTFASATSGSYGFAVPSGYSGLVIPIWFGGTFSPLGRSYISVVADQPNQDFVFTGTTPAPPTPPVILTGEVRLEGIPYDSATVDFSGSGSVITDSFGTYIGTVSYGYSGSTALSGFNPPVYTVTPSSRNYSGLTTNQAGQDFDIDINFLVISGTVTESGTGIPVSYANGFGTFATAASGSYGYYVPYGWSGDTIPLSGSGTFSPASYVYGPVGVDHLNDNFAFYAYPAPPVPTDCPIPGANVDIPLPGGNNASRNVIDPVNNLLWVLDESGPNVYYVDVLAGTYAGSVVTNSAFGNPCIAYDSANRKVVVSTYDGSLAFINPVSKAVTYSNFVQQWPGFHMLAISDAGTAFVADNRHNTWLYAVDCATEQLIGQHSLTPDSIFTDSICFAENIGQLVVNHSGPFGTRFFLFNPATGAFAASVLTSGAWSFNYENYYVRATGHVLMSRAGASNADIIDIAQGTNATILGQLPNYMRRISDATEDTCSNTLFVSDGNYNISEYTLDGTYTQLRENSNLFNGLSPTGLAHSRATNLIYWEDWSAVPIAVKSVQAVQIGTTIQNAVWIPALNQIAPSTGTTVTNGTFFEFTGTTTDANGRYMVWWDGLLTNTGAPYEAKVRFDYTGSQFAVITGGGVANTSQVEAYFFNQPMAQFVSNSNGSFGGVIEAFGTVYYGWNDITIGFATYSGMSNSPPSAFYTTLTGNATITVL